MTGFLEISFRESGYLQNSFYKLTKWNIHNFSHFKRFTSSFMECFHFYQCEAYKMKQYIKSWVGWLEKLIQNVRISLKLSALYTAHLTNFWTKTFLGFFLISPKYSSQASHDCQYHIQLQTRHFWSKQFSRLHLALPEIHFIFVTVNQLET